MFSSQLAAAFPRPSTGHACKLLIGGLLALAVTAPAVAVPTPQWKNYRWSRTGPLPINLGSNVGSARTPYLKEAAVDWTKADNIDFVQSAGRTTSSGCTPVYGSVQACSGNYLSNGSLGSNGMLANIDPSSDDFTALNKIYAKLDNTQLSYTKPDQVVGHRYGILDGVLDETVTMLPEPETWALLLTGFGFVGVSLRCRPHPDKTIAA